MSKVKVIPAVKSTRVVRTAPPKVELELTPSEAYHLYALLSCGVLSVSLRRIGLENLQNQLNLTFFPGGCRDSELALGAWYPAEIGFGEQRPLALVAERDTKIAERLQQLEKVDA